MNFYAPTCLSMCSQVCENYHLWNKMPCGTTTIKSGDSHLSLPEEEKAWENIDIEHRRKSKGHKQSLNCFQFGSVNGGMPHRKLGGIDLAIQQAHL